ncbi:MAG TPA: transglycosylase SLT domain-containing protein [Gemmatimonadales bacterium]|nr:transglycosylase SLT domain-containing protein [Gemmatimonadales bacterium]
MALAVCGFVAAVQLTPAMPVAAAPARPLLAPALFVSAPEPVAPAPVDSSALEREVVSRYEYRPLARLLGQHTRAPGMAVRIARAIVKEAGRLHVAPSLLTGVLLTENPRLESGSVSSQGAIGLMQVMHFHAGTFDCASSDLLQVEANICHGAHVFGQLLARTGDVHRALLRYNGCVVSANTPNCHRYPSKVMRAAGQVRRQLLLYPTFRFASDSSRHSEPPAIPVASQVD